MPGNQIINKRATSKQCHENDDFGQENDKSDAYILPPTLL